MRQIAKEPLVQFLVIGACIYGAYALFGTPQQDVTDNRVVVDAARIESFVGQWQQRWNRPPTRQELDNVIGAFVREDILYRAAVEMGLDQDDPITRRRMAQKIEFLTNDIALLKEPETGELEQYFSDNATRYRAPDRITFSQVFIDPDARGDSTLGDAAVLLADLEAAGEPDPAALDETGDRNMAQSYFNEASELEVRRQMGTGFAESVMELEVGQWLGPVLSGYGVHLVYVYAFKQAPTPVFAEAREKVLADWQEEQQEAFNEAFFESLKERFEVVIDEVPAGIVLQPPAVVTAADDVEIGADASERTVPNPAS